MRGRFVALVIAGAVAVGGVGVPLWSLAGLGGTAPAGAGTDLPWPYCAPDAERPAPSPTPWPELPADPHVLVDPAPAPLADLILVTDRVEPAPSGAYELAPGLRGVAIQAPEILWQAPGTSPPREEIFAAAPDALLSASGAEILVGLGERREDGMWSTRFAIVLAGAGATVLGASPFAERQTAILETFRTWDGNPRSGASARDLIVSWNEEAARGGGPIQEAWERFVERIVLQRGAYPRPGTPEWWAAAPPMCRSILDAPEDVRRALTFGTVWVRVPAAWSEVRDAALCLQTSVGSGGCQTFPRSGTPPYVRFQEAAAVPGEPVDVRVARLVEEGAVSWVERRTVARIPYRVFTETAIVLVDLAATGATMSSYEDLALATDPDAAPVRALRPREEEGLLSPEPSPDEGCLPSCEPAA